MASLTPPARLTRSQQFLAIKTPADLAAYNAAYPNTPSDTIAGGFVSNDAASSTAVFDSSATTATPLATPANNSMSGSLADQGMPTFSSPDPNATVGNTSQDFGSANNSMSGSLADQGMPTFSSPTDTSSTTYIPGNEVQYPVEDLQAQNQLNNNNGAGSPIPVTPPSSDPADLTGPDPLGDSAPNASQGGGGGSNAAQTAQGGGAGVNCSVPSSNMGGGGSPNANAGNTPPTSGNQDGTAAINGDQQVQSQDMYNYLTQDKGLSDEQAKGLIANGLRESGLNAASAGTDTNGLQSVGLFQWNGTRADAMTTAVPDWQTNWQGQVDYALGGESTKLAGADVQGGFINGSFGTANDASNWWVTNWERPANVSSDIGKNNAYINTLNNTIKR